MTLTKCARQVQYTITKVTQDSGAVTCYRFGQQMEKEFSSPVQMDATLLAKNIPTLLDVTYYVRLHTLLHFIGSYCAKFETGQTFSPRANGRNIVASVCT